MNHTANDGKRRSSQSVAIGQLSLQLGLGHLAVGFHIGLLI